MPVIDQSKITPRTGSIYPGRYADEVKGRSSLRLGDAGGLTQFGANLIILEPGAKSSIRHWHEKEDEFVLVLQGECVLIDNDGEHVMRPGDCAAFPAGDPNGHHFVNRSVAEVRFIVVGTRSTHEVAHYSDVDLKVEVTEGKAVFTRADGSPLDE